MSKELKILINNEEVVCDKQISIDEKMLSTSSTILKNCYPKFWETDKDYTSRFYFPKDYSKCRISYDEFHPEEQGEIVTGTNLTINYDITKNFELLQLQGNTYQQTYTGKNLCGIPDQTTSSGTGSVSMTINNGEITLNGTSTGATKYLLPIDTTTLNGNYTINLIYVSGSGSSSANFNIRKRSDNTLIQNTQTYFSNSNSYKQISVSEATSIEYGLYLPPSAKFTNYKFKIQIVSGTSSDYNYEPYVGGTPSPNPDYPQPIQNVTGRQTIDVVGKNLLPNDNTTQTISGITFTKNSDGSIKINGTSTAQVVYRINLKEFTLTSGTYTLSTKSNLTTGVIFQGWHSAATNFFVINPNNNSKTTTISSDVSSVRCQIVISNNVTVNNLVIYPMLEKGSTTTEYEEYKGQSYEINLGKNLFDKDNANVLNGFFNNGNIQEALSGQKTIYIPCKPNTTYTMSKIVSDRFQLAYANQKPTINSSVLGTIVDYTNPSITITTGNQAKYLVAYCYTGTDTISFEDMLETIQIETGSQATTYSSYFPPIELNKIGDYQDSIKKSTGKNLFDKDNITNGIFYDTTDGHIINTGAWTQSSFINATSGEQITIQSDYTTTNNSFLITQFDENQNWLRGQQFSLQTGKTTFTLGTNTKYIKIGYRNDRVNPNTLMLNEGSTALPYEPYGEGQWYIEKKIGKVVLDGSENWQDTGTNRFNVVNFITDYLKSINTKTYLSNYYVAFNQTNANSDFNNLTSNSNYGFNMNSSTGTDLRIKHTGIDNVSDFKTWLSTHNTEINYVLSTPTYIEITNTDLINQLENIELLNGINNITVTSPNVPGALKIHYNFKEAYTESDLVFCGVVKNTGNISLNPREPHYVDLQILDFKCLLSEGETLNYVINDKTIPEAIEQVVTSISDYGFVIGNINILNPNDKINAYSTLNKTAYDVFQYIADVTQSKWATRVIDEDTIAIDFYDPTLMPQASPIEYNQTYFENNDIENMTFNYSTNDYRNKQIMTSDEVFGNIEQIETIISNGYQDTYTCQNKIGIIKKITVNDVECTFATKNEVELGVTADFIYQPGEIVFTSSQIYTSGSVIVITYLPIVKGREIVLNNEESSRISSQINRKGTISRYENRNDTTSGQELIKIGQSYIKYKGSAEITLKIVSSKNLFNVGQIVEFNAPLEELSTEYMVKNKTIDIWTIDSNETQVFYTYELSSNFNSENAINYFDNQRAKNQGNIGEGETIVRNIDIENTALIQFYQTNIEEVEISNISTLDFSLDAVLI